MFSIVRLIFRRNHALESHGLYSNPVQYYDFLLNRVLIFFRPKFEDSNSDGEFPLILSKKQNYDTVREFSLILLLAHFNCGS